MSVNCRIRLPESAQLKVVTEVIGILAGCEKIREKLGPNEESYYTKVSGVRADGISSIPEMVTIGIHHNCIDGVSTHSVFFHFDSSQPGRTMCPKSTPFWIAMGIKLVEFFGGTIDFDDSDNIYVNYQARERSWEENAAQDGRAWRALQDRIFAVEALTLADLESVKESAAYKE